jgi:tetratricopeptide (TPR) repeat protein
MFYYILKKEFKLIFRDIHALLVLFLMPSIFILIMSLALKNTYSQNIESKLKVAIISQNSKDIDLLIEELNKNSYFEAKIENSTSNKDLIYELKYDFAIKLDSDFKNQINKNSKDFFIEIFSKPNIKYEFYTILKNEIVKNISKSITKDFFINSKIDAKNLDNLDNLISNQYIFKNEAIAIYGLIMAHFDNDPGSAWNLLQKSSLNPAQSPLTAYIFSSLALKNGDNDLAISYLQGSPKGVQYYSFPYLDFMLGTAKLRRLDADAPIYLNKYLHEFKGIHFIKECYQKLAWSELLHDNVSGYTQQMHNVKKYGAHVVDEDKQALRESDRGIIPQVTLLKARLLSDGGYYKRALELLESEQSLLQHPDYTLEANYRLGRIYHLEKKYTLAIPYYQKAIEKGVHSTTHYACASSLYIGTIYEIQKNFKLARFYFQKCLAITSGDYTSSLHQKAKAGLNRINE